MHYITLIFLNDINEFEHILKTQQKTKKSRQLGNVYQWSWNEKANEKQKKKNKKCKEKK